MLLSDLRLERLEMPIHIVYIGALQVCLGSHGVRLRLVDEGPHLSLKQGVLGLDLLNDEDDLFGPLGKLLLHRATEIARALL